MERSLVVEKVLPFIGLFAGLIVATLILDALAHRFDLAWIGRHLGIPGTILIALSFLYSLRKRRLISRGSPKTLLRAHEGLAMLGALMILVHAGIHFYAILPWLALLAMLANIISGMTGRYLLDRSRQRIAEKKTIYAERGLSEEQIEKKLFRDALVFDLMKKWRLIHFPITFVFVTLSAIHIFTIFLFWSWR